MTGTAPSAAARPSLCWLDLAQPADRWWPLLDPAERRRAQDLPTTLVRSRFVVRRGMLRQALAARLGVPAQQLVITVAANGRPELPHHPAIRFSTSHRGPLGVMALSSTGGNIGIDVEQVSAARVTPHMLAYTLTPPERAALDILGTRERIAAFHTIWTAKEAVAKAIGRGMARSFVEIGVTLTPAWRGCLAHDLTAPPTAWPVTRLSAPHTGYLAALVILPAPGGTP
ncbi:4'-phosphopantetheinyl transferase family protein [Streptomyces eurocidicus]|uniref:4'-phosphopantetheinyl transferase n=1 Tax=Streptomyces eurocidicus TaxID=66423 RepID=A0A7W8BBA1_STREU|nr:4'-phosphopantetheinyl transferase superfamily protein [Streptomyces eurocidicus]MBB5120219.1 4'-phosphopantetheinyl transferase [Streptomyces eurocidicus]